MQGDQIPYYTAAMGTYPSNRRLVIERLQSFSVHKESYDWASRALEYINIGSSRKVFGIGPRWVLKVARNAKFGAGCAQNEEEVRLWNASRSPALARVTHYDEEYRWIVAERVTGPMEGRYGPFRGRLAQFELPPEVRRLVRDHGLCLDDIKETSVRYVPGRGLVVLDYGYTPEIGRRFYNISFR